MGSGDKFKCGVIPGLCFGVQADTFPFALTVTLFIGPFWVSYGFGKGYDE